MILSRLMEQMLNDEIQALENIGSHTLFFRITKRSFDIAICILLMPVLMFMSFALIFLNIFLNKGKVYFVQKRMDATKGAISDREYSSFIASVPNLMQTEEGYRSLLNLMERANTAAVLRSEHLRSAAMSEGSSKQSVYKARQEWNNFRRNFPLGMIPSKSMTEVWGDYNKPDFNKDNMVFSVLGPDGTRQLTTYKDIVEGGRNSRDNLTAHSSIKRAFEKFDAVYVPLM